MASFLTSWWRRVCIVGGLLCVCPWVGAAQYRFDHWTADNGLPQNSVRDIVQTRDGYVWLATFDGLVRFDGVRFTVFNKSNSPGILTNWFTGLYEDGQGDLWASTEYGALIQMHEGRFTTHTLELGPGENYSTSLGGDGQGNLLLFIGSRLLRWANGRFQSADALRLPSRTPSAAERDREQHLVVSVEGQSHFYFGAGERRAWTQAEIPFPVSSPMEDRQGRIWVGSRTGLFTNENGRMAPSGIPGGSLAGRPVLLAHGRQPLQALSFGTDGSLWLIEVETQQSQLIAQIPPAGAGGIADLGGDIFVAYSDREGNLWLGMLHNGLYRVRKQSLTTYAQAQGPTYTEIYPLLEDRAEAVWIGAAGLVRFQDEIFTRFDGRGSFENHVSALYEDRAGRLWVNGVWRIENGRIVRVSDLATLPELSAGKTWTIHEDRTGAFWFGSGEGVVHY